MKEIAEKFQAEKKLFKKDQLLIKVNYAISLSENGHGGYERV